MAFRIDGACVPIEVLVMGMIDNNVYIIGDGEGCFVVDPTCEAQRILAAVGERRVHAIVLTHAHWDHVGAAAELRAATGATVVASEVDAPVIEGGKVLGPNHRRFKCCPVDRVVSEGDVVEIGGTEWKVIATPGHTPGSMCLFLDSEGGTEAGSPVLVAGDTLFRGAHGRTDFEGGSPADMSASLKRLAQLPGETIVLPGHNGMTTIDAEAGWMRRGGFGL
jgi:glyoxylase-like metal-dependent hydrolase (beta-lactamase superfamily II)